MNIRVEVVVAQATICLLFLHATTAGCWAQSVRGLVIDAQSGAPIPAGTVSLIDDSGSRVASVLTTEEGFFTLDSPGEGVFVIRAVALGYTPGREGPFELESQMQRVVELQLSAQPVELEGLVVEGTRSDRLSRTGFWERRTAGRGQFLTPEDVANTDVAFTPHLLRGLDHVVPQYGASPWSVWPILRNATGTGPNGSEATGPCEPRVFVDDVWVNRPGFGWAGVGGLDDIVPLEFVEAVELYWGPFQAPMRYQGSSFENPCGVVLIWTKG